MFICQLKAYSQSDRDRDEQIVKLIYFDIQRNAAILRWSSGPALPVTQRNAVKRRKTTFRFCTQGGSAAWHPTAPWLTLTDGRPSPWTGSRSWSGRGSAPRRLRLSASRRSLRTKWPSCSGLSGATRAKEKLWTCSQWMRISSAGAR